MVMRAENWVGEYTSTVGGGDIVLGGPIDGFCGFANAGDGVDVYYTIMDGFNKETGIGTIVSGNLIRKTIHAVLLDGSYIKGGSPLQLSGDAQVYLTANANFMDNIQALDADLAQTIAQVASLSQVTINGYGLSGNITLNASDVHARPDSWMPNSNDVGSYSKADSDQRYVATDAVEVGEQPGKIMIVGGPRDKQIAADIQNVSVVFVGQNPPLSPPDGKRWFDTTSGRTYIYYNDGDTKQWVEDSPQGNGLVDTSPALIAIANNTFGAFSHRNKIINGKMDIAQRGTSFTGVTTPIYTLDRWTVGSIASSAVFTASQQADAPSNNEFQNSLHMTVTTADTSIAAGDYSVIGQRIEGFNSRDLIGRTFTLSFWAKSSKTGVHCVSFANTGSDRSYVAEYTINSANTWEKKTVTVAGGLPTAGTWDWTNGIGLRVQFALTAGSTFQGAAGSWLTGNFFATANQVNCLDAIGNVFAITGVQLEIGASATPFEHRPISNELELCKRYYRTFAGYGGYSAPGRIDCQYSFDGPMRANPTLEIKNAGSNQAAWALNRPLFSINSIIGSFGVLVDGGGIQISVTDTASTVGVPAGFLPGAIFANAEL